METEVSLGAPSKDWVTWCPVTQTLTISRPPELTHDQLERIWSPFLDQGVTDKVLHAINRQIQHEVHAAQLRGEEERREQRRRQEEEDRRRAEERARAEQERRQREEQRRREEQEAKDKAEALLMRSLTDQQKEDLRTKNYFLVQVRGETYKINRGYAGNVKQLDENGREIRSFCIHPTERVPDADAMLAQKLLLETDPDRFHRTANITNLVPQNERRAA